MVNQQLLTLVSNLSGYRARAHRAGAQRQLRSGNLQTDGHGPPTVAVKRGFWKACPWRSSPWFHDAASVDTDDDPRKNAVRAQKTGSQWRLSKTVQAVCGAECALRVPRRRQRVASVDTVVRASETQINTHK